MKRAGFTMIELIFVIVILGILAAVAIPKLAATRSDAEAAKIAGDLATCIGDAGGAYLKNGNFNTVADVNSSTDWPSASSQACTSALDCFIIQHDDNNGTLTVRDDNTTVSKKCIEAANLASKNGMSSGGGAVHQF